MNKLCVTISMRRNLPTLLFSWSDIIPSWCWNDDPSEMAGEGGKHGQVELSRRERKKEFLQKLYLLPAANLVLSITNRKV